MASGLAIASWASVLGPKLQRILEKELDRNLLDPAVWVYEACDKG